ncbi:MAG: hypothetical protein IPL88_09110 [Rhizobiales bacterium]|nr:hypothetical protein [Hyphomicrobiales bacterium]
MVRCTRMAGLAPALVSFFGAAALWAAPAAAQSAAELRARLTDLYRVTISQDICAFPLSDAQADVVTQRIDDLETRLDLSEAQAQKLYDELEAQMKTQKESGGLCDPEGAWSRAYAKLVDDLKK